MHDHLVQAGQRRRQTLEDPARQHLAGGILQALDIVEVMVIELIVQRRKSRFDVSEIHHPAQRGIGLSLDMNLDTERMTVQARALVARRHVRKAVSRFDMEFFEDMHARILARGPKRQTSDGFVIVRSALTFADAYAPKQALKATGDTDARSKDLSTDLQSAL